MTIDSTTVRPKLGRNMPPAWLEDLAMRYAIFRHRRRTRTRRAAALRDLHALHDHMLRDVGLTRDRLRAKAWSLPRNY